MSKFRIFAIAALLAVTSYAQSVTGGKGGGSSVTIDTDATMAANSDTKVPSQKAVKTALDTKAASTAATTVNGQPCALGNTCALAVNNLNPGALPSGSTFSEPVVVALKAGACTAGTASTAFDILTATSTKPTATCKEGTNAALGVTSFTSGAVGQISVDLPYYLTSIDAIVIRFASETAAAAGNVVFNLAYACPSSSGGSIDPSWTSLSSITKAAGANNTWNIGSLSSPGISCAAETIGGASRGRRLTLKVGLDASTTAAGIEDIESVILVGTRGVTVQ